jgi:GST-like protein
VLELCFHPSPHGLKPLILLEESGLEYVRRPVDILRGEQFDPAFRRISPNNRIPALVDAATGVSRFDSGTLRVYVAERAGRVLPRETCARLDCLQWLFRQVGGLGPMAGQARHVRAFAPEVVPDGIRRYTDWCNRLSGVLERRLGNRDYVASEYSIADMAIWPWTVTHRRQGQHLPDPPRVADRFEPIRARPAVQLAHAIGHERHGDAEAYRHPYGQTARSPGSRP